jgi:hypothetical protein
MSLRAIAWQSHAIQGEDAQFAIASSPQSAARPAPRNDTERYTLKILLQSLQKQLLLHCCK